jgi:hypothetical protein
MPQPAPRKPNFPPLSSASPADFTPPISQCRHGSGKDDADSRVAAGDAASGASIIHNLATSLNGNVTVAPPAGVIAT